MTEYNDVPIAKYNETPIIESNDLIETDKGGLVKKSSYFIFGIWPAVFFCFILVVFGVLSVYGIILSILPIIGTIGLYNITCSEKHNPESTFILLLIGQLMMGLIVGYLLTTVVPWSDFSVSAILSYIVDNTAYTILLIIVYLALLGPIAVALHYQITVYRPWRVRQKKLDKDLYMQNIDPLSDVKAD